MRCAALPVMLDVRFGGFRRVMHGVLVMPVRQVCVVGGRLVIALFVMLGGFLVVPCGVLVMLCCLF